MKPVKLSFFFAIFILLLSFSILSCESSDINSDESSKFQVSENRDSYFTCRTYTTTNYDHVQNGRAEVFFKWMYFPYVKTIGSGEDLGMLGNLWWSPTTTIKNSSEGFFEIGECDPLYSVSGTVMHYPDERYSGDGDGDNEIEPDPVRGVEISLRDESMVFKARTNNDGFYRIIDVPVGIYYIEIDEPHEFSYCFSRRYQVKIIDKDLINIDFSAYDRIWINESVCEGN